MSTSAVRSGSASAAPFAERYFREPLMRGCRPFRTLFAILFAILRSAWHRLLHRASRDPRTMWQVTFEVDVEGIRLPSLRLLSPNDGVTIALARPDRSNDQTVRVVCHLDAQRGADARDRALLALEQLLDRLAVSFGARFHSPRFLGAEQHDHGLRIMPPPASCRASAHLVRSVTELEVRSAAALPWTPLARAFRHATACDDVVARYVLLYQLLLFTCDDLQSTVDAYILRKAPATPCSHTPRGRGHETIFTRLRNELAHVRVGTSHESTRRELGRCLPAFQTITREAVLEATCPPQAP